MGPGKATAAKLVNKYGAIETFPPDVLGEQQELALEFKELATLRADLPLFANVDELRWTGPTPQFTAWATAAGAGKLLERSLKAVSSLSG